MAMSMSKRKSGLSKKSETREKCSCYTFLCSFISRIPTAAFALMLIFLWSSTTTIITGNIVHVCVSSRKLSHLYCLSAGTHPNLEIPVSKSNFTFASFSSLGSTIQHQSTTDAEAYTSDSGFKSSSTLDQNTSRNIKEVTDGVNEDRGSAATKTVGNEGAEHLKAKIAAEQLMQLHRSWAARDTQTGCAKGGIYVYDLPSKYNKDLVSQCGEMIPWMDFCKYFQNEALGEPITELGNGWYNTHQYALEPIFHARILKHPCRVYDEDQASIFYVPYYGGLDILRWHFKNVSDDVKDSLGLELIKLLTSRKAWIKNSGKDHFFVLGKISWDFRRSSDSSWGTRFLLFEEMQNPARLLIERQPWEKNDFGIPHPTYFHPHSDNDITEWQIKILVCSMEMHGATLRSFRTPSPSQ